LVRVLHVIATLDPAGAERQLTHLCRRLDRGRFQPAVCCLTRGGPLESPLAEANVPVWIIDKRGKWDVAVLLRLRRVIREFRPQILHTWLPTANTLGRMGEVGCGVPVRIASERAADLWKGCVRRWIDRALVRRTARVVCNADALRRFLVEQIRLPAEKIAVIRNGLDLDEFDAAARAGPLATLAPMPEGALIGAVGRLEPQKGMTYLLDAFSRLPPRFAGAELWIAGDGPEAHALQEQAASAGVAERVRFLGLRHDVPALLERFDLFVLPSLWEGLPNAVLEAMAARRAVVATEVDGTPEAVVDISAANADEATGVLVPPRDSDALAQAMGRLLDDSQLRMRLGEAGRRRVAAEFGMERMVNQTQALYETALAEA